MKADIGIFMVPFGLVSEKMQNSDYSFLLKGSMVYYFSFDDVLDSVCYNSARFYGFWNYAFMNKVVPMKLLVSLKFFVMMYYMPWDISKVEQSEPLQTQT